MPRGPVFNLMDYADRVREYLADSPEHVYTDDIIKNVKGTDYRIVDALVYLLAKKEVKAEPETHRGKIMYLQWSLRSRPQKEVEEDLELDLGGTDK